MIDSPSSFKFGFSNNSRKSATPDLFFPRFGSTYNMSLQPHSEAPESFRSEEECINLLKNEYRKSMPSINCSPEIFNFYRKKSSKNGVLKQKSLPAEEEGAEPSDDFAKVVKTASVIVKGTNKNNVKIKNNHKNAKSRSCNDASTPKTKSLLSHKSSNNAHKTPPVNTAVDRKQSARKLKTPITQPISKAKMAVSKSSNTKNPGRPPVSQCKKNIPPKFVKSVARKLSYDDEDKTIAYIKSITATSCVINNNPDGVEN